MSETADNETLLFDAYLNGTAVRAQIRFKEPGNGPGELIYMLNERRVDRADFDSVMAACRAVAAEVTADALGEDGWVTTALVEIGDELKVGIDGTFAAKLVDATVAVADR